MYVWLPSIEMFWLCWSSLLLLCAYRTYISAKKIRYAKIDLFGIKIALSHTKHYTQVTDFITD